MKRFLSMGFVGPAPKDEDAHLLEFSEMLFVNGNLDLINLGQSNAQSQWLNSFPYKYKDYMFHFIEAEPKDGDVKRMKSAILNDIQKLKTGDYPDWLIGAVSKDLKRRFIEECESLKGIVYMLMDAFVHQVPLEDLFSKPKKYDAITFDDVYENGLKVMDMTHI